MLKLSFSYKSCNCFGKEEHVLFQSEDSKTILDGKEGTGPFLKPHHRPPMYWIFTFNISNWNSYVN